MKNLTLEDWNQEKSIRDLPKELLIEIQEILSRVRTNGKSYYTGEIDGIFGKLTENAFVKYKKDRWLEQPLILGKTTALSLVEESEGHHPTSEQQNNISTKINKDAGSKSGSTMKLPTGKLVYANEYIVEKIPLTWGEFTKNCSRNFEQKSHVTNALTYAKVWGEVRDKFGSPIGMTSGYRPTAINRAVGGASRSQHLYGKAGDIYALNGQNQKLYQVCLSSNFGGIGNGLCKGFVHTDIRGYRVLFGYGC